MAKESGVFIMVILPLFVFGYSMSYGNLVVNNHSLAFQGISVLSFI